MINIRDNLINRKIKGSVSLPIFNNHFTAKIKVSRLFLPNYCLLFLPYRIHQSLNTILFSVSIWPLHHWKPTQLTLYCNQTIQTFPERGERSTIWGSQVENMTNHSQLWIKRERNLNKLPMEEKYYPQQKIFNVTPNLKLKIYETISKKYRYSI